MSNAHNTITFEEAKQLMDTEENCILLDVREEDEYVTGHAAGAILFPLDTINAAAAAEIIPSKDTTILVYCRSGTRSRMAAQKLSELGYMKIHDIGSLVGWPYGMAW